jgi:pimeloyl-ACP methyl ester carboxylesterase
MERRMHGAVREGRLLGTRGIDNIEDSSHWVPLDQPQVLNALLLEFLAG